MNTFAVPKEVREAMLTHPGEAFSAMLGAAAEALKSAATNARHVSVKVRVRTGTDSGVIVS